MDTDALRLFVRAAEKRNISAAGRDLGMAPAVASARLARLERDIGAELLHRSTRKVSLSVEGQDLLPFAREILAQEDAAMAALGHGKARPEGTIRFAASSTFAQLYIAPLLPEFLSLHPGLRLDLRFSDTPFDLLEGSFDLALRNSALDDSSLKARKLADVRGFLCASRDYLAQRGTPVVPGDLAGHNLVAFRKPRTLALVSGTGERAQVAFADGNCRVIVDDGASMRFSAMAGLGISAHADWSVSQALADGSLVRVLPDWHVEDESALWLVYPKSNILTAKVRVLIDFLVERIGNDPPWRHSDLAPIICENGKQSSI